MHPRPPSPLPPSSPSFFRAFKLHGPASNGEEGEARTDQEQCGREGNVQEKTGAGEEGERTEHPLRGGGHGHRDEPLRSTTGGVAVYPASAVQSVQVQEPAGVEEEEEYA